MNWGGIVKEYDVFLKWLESSRPNVRLLPWQDEFARAYLHETAETLLAARANGTGKTFISDLLKEFKDSRHDNE